MSEYQYYEFEAIDRPLTKKELQEIREISSRAELTPTSFVNEYQWGDFKGNPHTFIEKYYDAFFYYANWGTRILMFRIPRGIIDESILDCYEIADVQQFWTTKMHLCIEFHFSNDLDEYPDDFYEATLADYLALRDDLLRGDMRAFYLGWLFAAQFKLTDEDAVEPPVPVGLDQLTTGLRGLAKFFTISPELIAAACEGPAGLTPAEDVSTKLPAWVKKLPAAERNELLVQLLTNDPPEARSQALARFRLETAKPSGLVKGKAAGRTVQELLKRRDELSKQANKPSKQTRK